MTSLTIDEAFGESRLPWWFLLVEGIAAIIIGILLLMNPYRMSILLVQVLAIYWFIKGIVSIISIFVDGSAWGWKLISGIIGIFAGYVLIEHPLGGTVTVATAFIIVLGIQGIIIGIVELAQAFQGAGWGVGILGALTAVIGLWLMLNALASASVLPWVLGVLAIAGGIAAIVYAFRAKEMEGVAVAEVQIEEVEDEPAPAPVEISPMMEEKPALEETPAEEMLYHESAGEEAKLKHELSFIEGIGPKYQEILEGEGIHSPMALLEAGATPNGRKSLAEKTGISSKLLLTWVNHADLLRIKGVGSQFADLLEEAGVDTVPELAQRNPENLHAKILEIHEEKGLVRRAPSLREVEAWVTEAKELPRIVRY